MEATNPNVFTFLDYECNLCNRKTNLLMHASCAHIGSQRDDYPVQQHHHQHNEITSTTNAPANITSATKLPAQRNHQHNKITSTTKSPAQQHHQRNESTSTTKSPANSTSATKSPKQTKSLAQRNHQHKEITSNNITSTTRSQPPATLHTLPTAHSTLHTLHSTLHTLHFRLYTLHSTLHTPHSTLSTPHSTLYTLRSTLYTLHSSLDTLRFQFHAFHFTLYTPHFTLHTAHSTLYTKFAQITALSTTQLVQSRPSQQNHQHNEITSTTKSPAQQHHQHNNITSTTRSPPPTTLRTLPTAHSTFLHTPQQAALHHTLHSTLYTLPTPHHQFFLRNWEGSLLGVQGQCFTPKMKFCSDMFCQNWRLWQTAILLPWSASNANKPASSWPPKQGPKTW